MQDRVIHRTRRLRIRPRPRLWVEVVVPVAHQRNRLSCYYLFRKTLFLAYYQESLFQCLFAEITYERQVEKRGLLVLSLLDSFSGTSPELGLIGMRDRPLFSVDVTLCLGEGRSVAPCLHCSKMITKSKRAFRILVAASVPFASVDGM